MVAGVALLLCHICYNVGIMLRVFCGKANEAARDAARACVQQYEQNGYEVSRMDSDNYVSGAVLDAAEAVSLFGAPTVFVLDTPSAEPVFWEEVKAHGTTLAQSETPFLIIEGVVTAADKRVFGDGVEWQEFTARAVERFNTFTLAEALATRNKKSLWVGLQAAYRDGQELAAIIGVLWWQLKMIRLVRCTNSPTEAGVKPFPFQKAKQARFSDAELAELQFSLLQVYHDARMGRRVGEQALEAWILRI